MLYFIFAVGKKKPNMHYMLFLSSSSSVFFGPIFLFFNQLWPSAMRKIRYHIARCRGFWDYSNRELSWHSKQLWLATKRNHFVHPNGLTISNEILITSLVLEWWRGGGALTLERGMGMCRGHDSLFSGQSPPPSLPIYPQWATRVTPVFNF